MKYLSLFSGIGGFEYGIQKAEEDLHRLSEDKRTKEKEEYCNLTTTKKIQTKCIGYSEIDKYARAIYRQKFTNHPDLGNATEINPKKLPRFDLLVAGFPCQSFSIAGKGRGFCDTRGTLFFEILRILEKKKPRTLLLENVKGLLSNDQGRTFQTMLRLLTEMGYDLEWQVLNSKDFGVPQNRERVFIIGHFRGGSRRKIFPIEGSNGKTVGKTVINICQGQRVYNPDGSAVSVKALGGGHGAKTGLYAIPTTKDGNSFCIDSNYFKGIGYLNKSRRTQIAVPVLTPDRMEKRQNGRRFKTDGEPSFTITRQDRHGVYDGFKIRRLTPLECERLQGFPDNWTKYGVTDEGKIEISDTQRYKCIGNAVTTNVIYSILKKILISL